MKINVILKYLLKKSCFLYLTILDQENRIPKSASNLSKIYRLEMDCNKELGKNCFYFSFFSYLKTAYISVCQILKVTLKEFGVVLFYPVSWYEYGRFVIYRISW